jgi:hypothetical protein
MTARIRRIGRKLLKVIPDLVDAIVDATAGWW